MAKKKSAFVMAGESAKDIVREASKTTRSNLLEAPQIIEAYNLSKGQTISIICKVSAILTNTHTDDPTEQKYKEELAGLPYVNFAFVPTSGPLKGGTIGNFMPCYDRKEHEICVDALEWIFREFQGLDYETEDWGLGDIEAHAAEVTENKPTVSLTVKCNDIKSGPRKGELVINCRIGRLITDNATDEEDDDDNDTDSVDAPVAEEKPAPAKRGAKKDTAYAPSVGDKVSYTFTETEDGEPEDLECEVLKVDAKKKTCTLNDGEYDYEEVKFAEVKPV
jgi:hypothetical protein